MENKFVCECCDMILENSFKAFGFDLCDLCEAKEDLSEAIQDQDHKRIYINNDRIYKLELERSELGL